MKYKIDINTIKSLQKGDTIVFPKGERAFIVACGRENSYSLKFPNHTGTYKWNLYALRLANATVERELTKEQLKNKVANALLDKVDLDFPKKGSRVYLIRSDLQLTEKIFEGTPYDRMGYLSGWLFKTSKDAIQRWEYMTGLLNELENVAND